MSPAKAQYKAFKLVQKAIKRRRHALKALFDDSKFRNLDNFHEVEVEVELCALKLDIYLEKMAKLKPHMTETRFDYYHQIIRGIAADADVFRVKVRIQRANLKNLLVQQDVSEAVSTA